MSDAESDDYEKLRIRQLATLVASSLETILAKADEQMDADAGVVQQFLRLMASESGEFVLPVPKARLDTLRTSMRGRVSMLDGGFVGTVKAYMQKASDDSLDGVVDVLRVLLQVFASERLRSLTTSQLAAGGAARGVSGNAVWGYLSGNGLLSAVAGGRIAAQTAVTQCRP